MQKTLLIIALSAATIATSAQADTMAVPDGYKLEKAVILSRHGIRAPLIGYGSALADATYYEIGRASCRERV